jgi:hypothetical protein
MPNQSIFFDLLNNSKVERTTITIYLTNHLISGIVANLNNDTVELYTGSSSRCVVVLDRIEAISIA